MFSKQVAKMAKQAKVLAKKKFYQVRLWCRSRLARSGSAGFRRRFRRRSSAQQVRSGAEPVQVQQGFGEGSRRTGAKPAQVERGFK